MKAMKITLTLLTTCAVALGASHAHANGLILQPTKLAPAERAQLVKEVEAAKRDHAAVRAKVRDVQGVRPEVYQKRRNPRPEATAELRALGKDALFPMLEAIAIERAQPGLAAEEQQALAVGLLSAVGELRDARAQSVLTAVLEGEASSTPIALAAALGLGKRCDDAALGALKAQTGASSKVRAAALEGLGECRRAESLAILVDAARAAGSDAEANGVARALGAYGSSCAWSALGKTDDASAQRARRSASAALVALFVRVPGARVAASRGILMCEADDAVAALEAAKVGADDETKKAIQGLVQVLQRKQRR